MKKDVEYYLRVQVINYMLELEKIYNIRLSLEFKNGEWQIVHSSTSIVFTSAETLETLRDILKLYIEKTSIFVPQ